ncbi:hypothetical protein DNTS_020510 [Danionella cerebrum]|uniref:Uncharacterized protein n=1 Tax=Danionella cerebrum TaxID=2873325 RepID=A0A553P985_9TELE|nr:hypothetical protein DNTS_020510 [Danionella translucida]
MDSFRRRRLDDTSLQTLAINNPHKKEQSADSALHVSFIKPEGKARVPSPLVLISMLFLCLGGPCNKGPLLAQPEE